MINEIPNKPNHKIIGYKEIKPCRDDLPILYEPIYERILSLDTIYWDKSRNERIYLTSDTKGFDCKGNFIEIDTKQLDIASKIGQEMFHKHLSHNGYEIKDGALKFRLNCGDIFMTSQRAIVIYLSDGCHTTDNTIIGCALERRATEFETEIFFNSLELSGFIYNPIHKCITKLERHYYFPSYSLYNGFQPEKKKWTNSTVDRFYKKHGEDFVNFNDCVNFCNNLNRSLMRDYPEIKLEE